MDVSYINPFIKAMCNCFEVMIGVKLTHGNPALKSQPLPTYDISGIIGLSGDAKGSVTLSFPFPVAIRAVSKMIGSAVAEDDPELSDGIGELTNIVAGGAKADLLQFNMSISLPNIIIGRDHILTGRKDCPTIVIPFNSELGTFAMEINLITP